MVPTLYRKVILEKCSVCNQVFDIQKREIGYPNPGMEINGLNFNPHAICLSCVYEIFKILVFYEVSDYDWIGCLGKSLNDLRRKKCIFCGDIFVLKHGNQKYCSDRCFKEYRKIYKRKKERDRYKNLVISKRKIKLCKYCKKPLDQFAHGNTDYHMDCWENHRFIYLQNYASQKGFPSWEEYKKYTSTFCWECKKPYVFHITIKRVYRSYNKILVYRKRKCQNCGRIHESIRERRLWKEDEYGNVRKP